MSSKQDNSIKIGLGVWVCFCVLIAIWVFTKFLRGRQQLYSNLNVVEDSLRKMQEKLDVEQRKKSMGYVENLEDITACLSKSFESGQKIQDEDGEEAQKFMTTENEINKLDKEDTLVEQAEEDKKHI